MDSKPPECKLSQTAAAKDSPIPSCSIFAVQVSSPMVSPQAGQGDSAES